MDIEKVKKCCTGLTGHPPSSIFGFVLIVAYSFLQWKFPDFANILSGMVTGGAGLALIRYKGKV